MRTTLIWPDNLINESMKLTRIKSKTGLIKEAVTNLIEREQILVFSTC